MKDIVIKIQNVLSRENNTKDVSADIINELLLTIHDSPFIEKESKRLALNVIHFLMPKICGNYGLSDFVTGDGVDTLETLNRITGKELEITSISTSCLMDWEMLDDGEEKLDDDMVSITANINGKPFECSYDVKKADDTYYVASKILDLLRVNYPTAMKYVIMTRTVESVNDVVGSVIVCNLPNNCADEIVSIIDA